MKGVKEIMKGEMSLKELSIEGIRKGSEDVGKVEMEVEYEGEMYYGFGGNREMIGG